LRSGEFPLKDVCFNLLWATTLTKFSKNIDAEQITSGFLARFLIAYGEKDFAFPRRALEPEDFKRKEEARVLLQQVWDYFHSGQKTFTFDEASFEVVNAWQTQKEDELSRLADLEERDIRGAVITRMGEYLMKLSALFEVDAELSKLSKTELSKENSENSEEITINMSSVNKAVSIIDNLLSSLSTKLLSLLSSGWLSKNLVKLTKLLEGKDWIQRQHLLPYMNMTSKRFDEILKTAYDSNLIEVQGTRPQVIRLVKK
jgi:hypothetical protein